MQFHELVWKKRGAGKRAAAQGSAGNPRCCFAFPVTANPVSGPND